MEPNRRGRRVCLPALPIVSGLEGTSEQGGPEASSPLGVIGGKLDQRQPRAGHTQDNSHAATVPGCTRHRLVRMRIGPAIAVGAVTGLALGIVIGLITEVPLAPEVGLVLGALGGWLSHRDRA